MPDDALLDAIEKHAATFERKRSPFSPIGFTPTAGDASDLAHCADALVDEVRRRNDQEKEIRSMIAAYGHAREAHPGVDRKGMGDRFAFAVLSILNGTDGDIWAATEAAIAKKDGKAS